MLASNFYTHQDPEFNFDKNFIYFLINGCNVSFQRKETIIKKTKYVFFFQHTYSVVHLIFLFQAFQSLSILYHKRQVSVRSVRLSIAIGSSNTYDANHIEHVYAVVENKLFLVQYFFQDFILSYERWDL